MKAIGKVILAIVFLGAVGWTSTASAQADFYKGKTITVYIGTTAGAVALESLVSTDRMTATVA